MGLAWKNRFLESRDAVMLQFEEMAGILGEFSGQMEQAEDVTETLLPAVRMTFRKHRVVLEDLLVLKYGDGHREAFLTARTGNGRCVTVKDAAALFGQAVGSAFVPARSGKTLITRNSSMARLIEKGSYRLLIGSAKTPKEGEEVSGDNYMFRDTLPGQVALSLSDGMGSGPAAGADSERVMELAEQLLDTGFSARSTLKLINTVLLLNGMGDRPATMDLYGSAGDDEAWSGSIVFAAGPTGRRRGGDSGVGDSSGGSAESCGAGDDIEKALGRG